MPVVSVRIDAESSYTIHFEDEYSFPDFVKTIEKHVHVINQISGKSGPAEGDEAPEADNALKDQVIDAPPEAGPEKRSTTEKGGGKMGKRRVLPAALAVLLLVLGGGLLLRFAYDGNSEVGKGGAAVAEKAAQVPKNPLAAPDKGPPAPLPELNRLLLEARETAWVKVTEDYNPAYRIVLRPGERLEREATRFVLQIGNAKGVDISFNGEKISAIRPGAKSTGKVISLTLPGKTQTGRELSSAGKQTRQ